MQHEPIVHVIDDDASVRASLAFLLSSVSMPCETFASVKDFLAGQPARARQASGDPVVGCVIADVRMPGLSGFDLMEHVNQAGQGTPVILITGHGDVPMAVRALKMGAFDFVTKPFNDQNLLDTVRRAIQFAKTRSVQQVRSTEVCQRLARLSPREREVFDLVTRGSANKIVAAQLGLSEKTVEIHRSNVMRKMEADSLATLVRMAVVVEAAATSNTETETKPRPAAAPIAAQAASLGTRMMPARSLGAASSVVAAPMTPMTPLGAIFKGPDAA